MIILTVVRYKVPKYGDYEYPEWAKAIGWVVGFASVAPIPIVAFYVIMSQKTQTRSILSKIRSSFKPSTKWQKHLGKVILEAKLELQPNGDFSGKVAKRGEDNICELEMKESQKSQ